MEVAGHVSAYRMFVSKDQFSLRGKTTNAVYNHDVHQLELYHPMIPIDLVYYIT